MAPERSSGEREPESQTSRFQLAARRAQGQMTDAAWWQLGASERVRAIYEQLRHLDRWPGDSSGPSSPEPDSQDGAGAINPD